MFRNERLQRLKSDKADRRGLMAALDAAQALVWFAPDGAILEGNANLQNMLAMSQVDLQARSYFDLIHGPDRKPDPADDQRWARISTGALPNEERSFFTSTGAEVWSSANYAAICNEAGVPRRVLGIIIDLSPWSWRPNDSAIVGRHF